MQLPIIKPTADLISSKKVLIQEIESGGLKMPDISSMLKAVKLDWLKRLCVKETLYTHFASSLIGRGLGFFIYEI